MSYSTCILVKSDPSKPDRLSALLFVYSSLSRRLLAATIEVKDRLIDQVSVDCWEAPADFENLRALVARRGIFEYERLICQDEIESIHDVVFKATSPLWIQFGMDMRDVIHRLEKSIFECIKPAAGKNAQKTHERSLRGNPALPKNVRTKEDIVRFFSHVYIVDGVMKHPDDNFMDDLGDDDAPWYTQQDATLRNRLMKQAKTVAKKEGLDIYEMASWMYQLTGYDDETEIEVPEWVRDMVAKWTGQSSHE